MIFSIFILALARAAPLSPHSSTIQAFSKALMDAGNKSLEEGLSLECLSTPGNETYIGVVQRMVIAAPLEKVESILDEVGKYPEIFEDMIRAERKQLKGDSFTVVSEQKIGIPFVPNEVNELRYEKSKLKGGEIQYVYDLLSSKHLKFNDGLIRLGRISPQKTSYIELDFWDADWGIAKSFGVERLWKSNLGGVVQADLAVKLRAENPDWATSEVKKESLKRRDDFDKKIEQCVKSRSVFSEFLARNSRSRENNGVP